MAQTDMLPSGIYVVKYVSEGTVRSKKIAIR